MPHPSSPERLLAAEHRWCLRVNALCSRRCVWRYFASISRLGDGLFWYALMALLVVADGSAGLRASLHLAVTGVVALFLYKWLKHRTRRSRPFASDLRIRAWVAPLDEYSFPSGHTLHAVAFSVVAVAHYPVLAWLLVPFSAAWRHREWYWGCITPAMCWPPPGWARHWPQHHCGWGRCSGSRPKTH